MLSSNVLPTGGNTDGPLDGNNFHWMTTLDSKELTETYLSIKNNKRAIVSDEFRLRQNYRKVPRF